MSIGIGIGIGRGKGSSLTSLFTEIIDGIPVSMIKRVRTKDAVEVYAVDLRLTDTGFAGVEDTDYEMIYGREVISGIDVFSWTPPDFLTTNSAPDNVAALNDAVTNHSYVKITTPGVYEINDTIWLNSNQRLEFTAGSTIKKATGSNFCHVFANKGILTATRNSNIEIIGNGLIIAQNGIDFASIPSYRMIGNIAFFRVDGLKIDNIQYLDGLPTQYFSHFADINNFSITNIGVNSDKDGLHFDGKTHDGIISDCDFTTNDDNIALLAKTWPILSPCTGDIYNIVVSNITGVSPRSIPMSVGSWAAWATGNTYNNRDFCVNAGRIYFKSNAAAIVGSNAPTHSSGVVTGADGIAWTFYQDGTITEANIYNLTFDNLTFTSPLLFKIASSMDAYTRDVYPGTEGNAYVDNISINGVSTILSADSTFLSISPVTTTKLFSCKTINIDNLSVTANGFNNYLLRATQSIEELNIDNCNITFNQVVDIFAFNADSCVADININNSVFSNIKDLLNVMKNNLLININAIGSSFINNVTNLITINGAAANSVINFVADDCTFEETSSPAFSNSNATSNIIVATTNSLGDSQPQLKYGTVDVTGSDLVLALGDNIVRNGKFRYNVVSWTAERGAIAWSNDETLRFTASGVAGTNDITAGVTHPLSNNLNIKFRAKSVGATNTMSLNTGAVAIINPALTTNWQNYEFTFAIAAGTTLYLKCGTNLAAGVIVDFDDVFVVQY